MRSFYHFPSEVPFDSMRIGCSWWHKPLSEAPTAGLKILAKQFYERALMMSTCWSEHLVSLRIHLNEDIREFFTLVTRKQFKQLYPADFSWVFYYLFIAQKTGGEEMEGSFLAHKCMKQINP